MNFPTFLIFNLDDKLNINQLASYIGDKYTKYQIIVASTKFHENVFNVEEFVFEEKDQDKIINALMTKVNGNKLVLARKLDNDNFEELVKLEQSLKHENQIAKIKKERNKVSSFLFDLFNKIITFIFGYTFYDCNICCMAFANVPLEVMKVMDNCSLYTKVNKWNGINFVDVDAKLNSKVHFKPKILKNIIFVALSIFIIAGAILSWIFVEYIQNQFLLQLLLVFVIVVCLYVVCVEILSIYVKKQIGDNIFDKAKIMNKN